LAKVSDIVTDGRKYQEKQDWKLFGDHAIVL
jgi:hypothetical protein